MVVVLADEATCRSKIIEASGQNQGMSHEKVLIVEDEENERTGLAELVSSWGYRAETARDGVEGLEKAAQWTPSIVVTDLKMPRMGGIELLERLGEQSQAMAVILVTAQGTIDSAVQAMRMGAYDYITKPIDTNRLRTMLQNASALVGTRAELESARRKLRDSGSLGQLNGGIAQDAGDFPADRAGCAQHCVGADYGSQRHGQGVGGSHHPSTESAPRPAFRRHQLRGHS